MHTRWLVVAVGLIGVLFPASARADVPTNVTQPSMAGYEGPLYPGSVLTEVAGTWSGSPTSLAVQWVACDASGCADVPGAIGQTYTVRDSDVGKSLTARETARNADGASAPAGDVWVTNPVRPTPPPPPPPAPVLVSNPKLTGQAIVGQILKTTSGKWTSSAPLTYTYQWMLCHGPCAPIPGATGPTLKLIAAYVGDVVFAQVTATNAGGYDYADSSTIFGTVDFSEHDLLLQGLTRTGSTERIGQLLKHGGYLAAFAVPHPGVLRVTWTRQVMRHGQRRTVLVAGATELTTGPIRFKLELTSEGRKLLKHVTRLTVHARARLYVGKKATGTATADITLTR
jgi:hypothetical protein